MIDPEGASPAAAGNAPPCKRCGNRTWAVAAREKSRLRWMVETAFAAPDVWVFQSESAGWPGRHYELWTCRSCGHKARIS